MSAPELTEAEAAIVAAFEAAPVPPESFDPIAVLRRVEALAEELQREADSRGGDSLISVAERSGLLIAVTRLRAALAPQAEQ